MFNAVNGNGTTVTEKLGLDSEVRELKFGSSFNQGSKGQPQGGFHTIRYDFKPASVDTSKMATLEVGPSGQVTISMPHYDSSGNTVFKGSTKPYTKECVLIIDKDTGEVVLEKLSHNVQVKKTRQEGGSRSGKSGGIQPGPAAGASGFTESAAATKHGGSSSSSKYEKSPPTQQEKPSRNFSSGPSSSSSGSGNSHLHPSGGGGGGLSSSSRRRPNSPMTNSSNISRHSPKVPSPGRSSPSPSSSNNANSNNSASTAFDALISSKSQQQSSQNSLPSLTSIEDLLITPPAAAPPPPLPTLTPKPVPKINVVPETINSKQQQQQQQQIPKPDKMMSDSSSDSSSSSSSDEDDDDDSSMDEVDPDADPDKIPLPKVISGINNSRGRSSSPAGPPIMNNMSMPSFSSMSPHVSGSSSSSSSSKQQFHHTPSLTTSSSSSSNSMSMPSMPSNILSQDLQLSESGSDSDD